MDAKNLIGGLIIGTALGVAAGILMAPKSGAATRKNLVKGSMKMKKNVVGYIDDSIDGLRDQLNTKIEQLAKRGKETVNFVSDRVKV